MSFLLAALRLRFRINHVVTLVSFSHLKIVNKPVSCLYSQSNIYPTYIRLYSIMPPKGKKAVKEIEHEISSSEKEDSPLPEDKNTKKPGFKDTSEEDEPLPEKKTKKRVVKKTKKTKSKQDESDDEPLPEEKTKRAKKQKDEMSTSEKEDSPLPEEKTKKRAKKQKDEMSTSEKEDSPLPEVKTKKRGAKKNGSEPAAKKAKTEPVKEDKPLLKDLDFTCTKTTPSGEKPNFKISTWNVAGIRAWIKKSGIDYIKKEDADIVCLQETKCADKKLPPEMKTLGYYTYWAAGEKEGYAGVGLMSKEKPIKVTYGLNIKEHDTEGRLITAEYEKFYLVTTYVPNAGSGLKTLPKRLKWNTDFQSYVKDLDSKKPVIICGDMNVAHTEIDIANPKNNVKNAGFTPEEREGMTEFLKQGFIDTYRNMYPEEKGAYTFWTYMSNARARNTGWRLDYFIVSERFLPSVCDNIIRNKVYGSDHCPVTLFIHV